LTQFQSAYQLVVRYHKVLSTLLVIGVTVLSLIPLPQLPDVPGNDKTMHLVAYAVLAFPVSLARPKGYAWLLLGFLVWSGVIELVQPLVNRTSDLVDLIANATGLMLGYFVARIVDTLSNPKK
jgi:VanZ family protein